MQRWRLKWRRWKNNNYNNTLGFYSMKTLRWEGSDLPLTNPVRRKIYRNLIIVIKFNCVRTNVTTYVGAPHA